MGKQFVHLDFDLGLLERFKINGATNIYKRERGE
jgi:hypothetical protein